MGNGGLSLYLRLLNYECKSMVDWDISSRWVFQRPFFVGLRVGYISSGHC